MNPGGRIRLAVVVALLVGGVVGFASWPTTAQLDQLRVVCLSGSAGRGLEVFCPVLVRYPNRLPAIIALVVLLVLALAGLAVSRWCLRPFDALTDALTRMGPTNLGYRLGWRRRRDTLGRLGHELDATLDRIAAGYDSQRRFAANASHELRTPLAVQRTLIEVGMSEALTDQQLALLTRQLLATNERNERVIDGLLVLAETEEATLASTPLRLDEIAATVVEAYRTRAEARRVTLSVTGEPTTILGEAALVERLVSNLVQNAIAYNLEEHGTVDVRVTERRLEVTNSGPVVAPEDVPGLFEPFRRGGGDRLAGAGGAGLGLTITRTIAVAHDAVITARPGPAGGLAVRVDFPAAT